MSKNIREGIVLLLLLLPTLASAHEGHAAPGLAHDLHHASWLVFGAAIVVAAIVVVLSSKDREEP